MKDLKIIYFLIAAIALGNLGAGNPGASLVEEGNRLFSEGKYDEALTKYSKAQVELPQSPEIYYNIGDAQYGKGDYEKSSALFQKAGESEDISLNARAGYNLGNTLFREEKYQEAIAAYKASLKLNPEDKDAKFNFELARHRLKKQQQDKQQQQDRKEQEKEKEEQEQEDKQDKEEKEERKEKEDQQQQENKDKSDQPDQKHQPPPEEGEEEERPQPNKPDEQEMNQEDVERLLDAMLAEEEDQRVKQMEQQRGRMPEVLKDW